jgi:glycosyltransferase involved in cell wall biosynthesis
LTRTFPEAPLYTSVYVPERYPELVEVDVHTSFLNRIGPLRSRHRIALPLLSTVFRNIEIDDADVVVCSSSGWSHGVTSTAPKVVYCHNPPRWLYQREEYARTHRAYWLASLATTPYLKGWDRRAASSCARFIANSSVVAERIRRTWGRDAEVLPPPSSFDRAGPQEPIEGVEPGFVLLVSRLLGYKNVAPVVEAFASIPDLRLVVIGHGPLLTDLQSVAPTNVTLVGRASEDELRWAYAQCLGLVSASHEDFGLTPVEAAMFGKPSALLRAGGFLDTAIEGVNAVTFDQPEPREIADGIARLVEHTWSENDITRSAERFSERRFSERLHEIVDEVSGY